MTFKRPLPVSFLPPEINDKKSSFNPNSCKVCGDEARFFNYGVLSCQSCKIFFHRNGFRPEIVRPCQYDERCEVNMLTRKKCTACRLAKCLSVGMSPDLIRKEDLRYKKFSSTTTLNKTEVSQCKALAPVSSLRNKQLRVDTCSLEAIARYKCHNEQVSTRNCPKPVLLLPTLDLLRNDRSSLTTSEWRLLSNILHAYDLFSVIPRLHDILNKLSSPCNEVRFDPRNAFEIIGSIYTSMESFVHSIPDFQVLTVNEQRSLFERNLHGIVGFCFHLAFRDTNFLEHLECYQCYAIAYGPDILKQSHRLLKQMDLDSTLVKFILIITAFSSNCFIVDVHENMNNDSLVHGTFRLLGSQNIFVELLWKYMIYRYGHCETVARFTGLIKYILNTIRHAAGIYTSNEIHHDFVDDVVDKTKETLIISQSEPIPLWGKTLPFS